jgi:hypothetical protein
VQRRALKQLNAIDQADNENKPTQPTKTRVVGSIWQTSYIYRTIEGVTARVPLNADRYNVLQSPVKEGFFANNALNGETTSNKLTGFRTVDLLPKRAVEYNNNYQW